MIGRDTHVLGRYDIDDKGDAETKRQRLATFDDRKFARRAKKLGLTPTVTVLS